MDVPVYGIRGRVVEIFLERPGSDEAHTVLWFAGQTGLVGAVAAGLTHTVRFSFQYTLLGLSYLGVWLPPDGVTLVPTEDRINLLASHINDTLGTQNSSDHCLIVP